MVEIYFICISQYNNKFVNLKMGKNSTILKHHTNFQVFKGDIIYILKSIFKIKTKYLGNLSSRVVSLSVVAKRTKAIKHRKK